MSTRRMGTIQGTNSKLFSLSRRTEDRGGNANYGIEGDRERLSLVECDM